MQPYSVQKDGPVPNKAQELLAYMAEPRALPARVQKISCLPDGAVVFELFVGSKRWLLVDSASGRAAVLSERPARAEDAPGDSAMQGLLRKVLQPSQWMAVDVDGALLSLRFSAKAPGAPDSAATAYTLHVERDPRGARIVVVQHKDATERILGVLGNRTDPDGRDLRRGRLWTKPTGAWVSRTPAEAPADTVVVAPAPVLREVATLRRLAGTLAADAKRLRRLHQALEEDLRRHGDPARLFLDGELLKGVFGTLRRGMSAVDVVDVDGTLRTVPLAPEKDARENLAHIFKRARRAQHAAERIAPRLSDVIADQAALERVRAQVRDAVATSDDALHAAAVHAVEVWQQGHRTKPSARRAAQVAAGRRVAWRTFVVSTGARVRVGRSAKDNDLLRKSAQGNDLWLHARDATGSHVVVADPGATPPPELVLDAAHLAAHFSAVRGEQHVDVQMTRIKHLKHPGKGAPAGLVHVAQETVLHVRVEPDRLTQLLQGEIAGGG